MSCMRRERTGRCGHAQCPHPDKTPHGFDCVELAAGTLRGRPRLFCEIGDDCLPECRSAWRSDDADEHAAATAAFRAHSPDLEQRVLG